MTVLMTGFPGFLGSALLPGILHLIDGAVAICLVQPKFTDFTHFSNRFWLPHCAGSAVDGLCTG
jgi:hypothetical protein